MASALVEQIARGNTSGRSCFEFTNHAAHQFAQQHTGQPDCPRAIRIMSHRVRASGDCMQAWLPAEVIHPLGSHRTAVDACQLDFTGGPFFSGHPHAGPQLGKLILRTSPWRDAVARQIVSVAPCDPQG